MTASRGISKGVGRTADTREGGRPKEGPSVSFILCF